MTHSNPQGFLIRSRIFQAAKWSFWRAPEGILIGGFTLLIFLGAFLLWMPFSHPKGHVTFLDALFSSTSAVCVTGLSVIDIGTELTTTGQLILLTLIQMGGLGWMTFAALIFYFIGKGFSLKSQAVLEDSIYQGNKSESIKQTVKKIFFLTAVFEGAGILLITLFLTPDVGLAHAVYSAAFHSISSFCNAGFSIYQGNLMDIVEHTAVLYVIMALIIFGGLGHTVLIEIWKQILRVLRREKATSPHLFTPHARVVFAMSAGLIAAGTLGLLIFGTAQDGQSLADKFNGALFQSVTSRTAGFNSVNVAKLPLASIFMLVLLMFVGGSPGSCAGGIKTSTMAIYLARLKSRLRGVEEVVLMDKRVPHQDVRKATLLFALALGWNIFGILFLCSTETGMRDIGLQHLIFEQVSAFGTVGLSMGITPNLTPEGQIWIILTMFLGRVGPMTIAAWVIEKKREMIAHPEGRFMVG